MQAVRTCRSASVPPSHNHFRCNIRALARDCWKARPGARAGTKLRQRYTVTIGELGASAAQTTTIALLPVLLSAHTESATLIGLIVGGEGIFALLVPALVGRTSDVLPRRLARRIGRRTPFLGASALVMSTALVLLPFIEGLWTLAAGSFVLFVALHAYLTPLWTLLVDEVEPERWGQVQGARGAWRTGGLAYGLIPGGVLFDVWRPLPFLLAAALLLVTSCINIAAARSLGDRESRTSRRQSLASALRKLRGNRPARWTLIANALWNGAIDGVRPYIFLFAVGVFGLTITQTSLGLIVLAVTLALGSLLLGTLSDRYSRVLLMVLSTLVGGLAMTGGLFLREAWVALAVLVVAGLGMSSIIAIGYPLFAGFVGKSAPGTFTGVFVMNTGFGRIMAPVLVGAAIDVGRRVFEE